LPATVARGVSDAVPPVGTVLLESGRADRDGGRSLRFQNPIETETLDLGADPRELFGRLQAHLDAGRWVAGTLAFEAGYPLVDLPAPARGDGPLAWFGVYDAPSDAVRVGPATPDGGPLRSGTRAFRFATSPRRWAWQVE